jgi:AraC-like DNA-binding protein
MNLISDQVEPRKIHLFRRSGPGSKQEKMLPNIHNQYIIWVCLEGVGRLQIEDVEYQLYEDDVMLCFPGQPHMRIPLEEKQVEWLLIRFEADEREWFSAFRNMTFHLCERSGKYLKQLVQAYLRARNTPHPMWNNECAGLLALLLNSMRTDSVNRITTCEITGQSRQSLYVKKVATLIISGKCNRKAIRKAAGEFGITSDHLRSVFKQATGRSINETYKKLRFSRAVHLLMNSSLNVTQIAEILGFGSVYSFSRFFKQASGISPKRYSDKQHISDE